MIGNPKELRLAAARCLLLAAESATSLETREELIALAHMWVKRAGKLESDLLEQEKNVSNEVQKLPAEASNISVLAKSVIEFDNLEERAAVVSIPQGLAKKQRLI
jgi:hypothetical protein